MAAPDPHDPDVVYGSARNGVSRYDRRTGQTTQVGPDTSGTLPGGGAMNRNVRTMPLHFSPIDGTTMFYASNVVWKSIDHGHSWSRISPDLTRQTWEVPANTGKYASTVKPAPMGSITALSPSPRSLAILWAGTDDGNIQMTRDGGATWTDVTPSADQAVDADLQHRSGTSRSARRVRGREHAASRRDRAALLPDARRRQDVDRDRHRHRAGCRRQHDSRGSSSAGTALRRNRHTGVGVVRRWRSLAVAAPQHAGDLGPRSAGEGRREVRLRGFDCGDAWTRLLDSRQPDAAAPGGSREGGAREERAVSLQAGNGDSRPLRHQRADAVAAGASGRRERAAWSADRLLPREGRQRSDHARDPRPGRQGRPHVLQHGTGVPSGSGQGHGRVRRGVHENADGRRTAACRSTGRRRSSSSRPPRACTVSVGI